MANNPIGESLARARAAHERGDAETALALFRSIAERHPDSPAANTAREYIAAAEHVAESRQAAQAAPGSPTGPAMRVTVVDLDISFGQLVSLFVKAAIAIVPAAIILGALGFFVFVLIGAVVGNMR